LGIITEVAAPGGIVARRGGEETHMTRFQRCLLLSVGIGTMMVSPLFAGAQVVYELYTDRAAFEARIGGDTVRIVNFDDIDTSSTDPVSFAADRYQASHGIVISGENGSQFVSRTFTFPGDFPPTSGPNMYAPGPVDGSGNQTDTTFFVGDRSAFVTGFGAYFIDVDFPETAPSSLTIFGSDGTELASHSLPNAGNGSQQFRGFVAVDSATDTPVPAIFASRLINGQAYPALPTSNEGVTLDDFTFSRPSPVPAPGALATALMGAVPGLCLLVRRRRK
jgi:hypothetical protein